MREDLRGKSGRSHFLAGLQLAGPIYVGLPHASCSPSRVHVTALNWACMKHPVHRCHPHRSCPNPMTSPAFTRMSAIHIRPDSCFLQGSAPHRVSWGELLALDRESDELPRLANHLLVELRSRGSENIQFTEEEGFRLIELIDTVVWAHSQSGDTRFVECPLNVVFAGAST
jgi:hypothetical protein